MREITKLMIEIYNLRRLKYDFMGYQFDKVTDLSFHHLVVPHKDCKEYGLGEGYLQWNGAILCKDTSHPYLHIIAEYDYDRFAYITNEMIEQNSQCYLDMHNIRRIDGILNAFEREYCGTRNRKGKLIIKEEYTKRLIKTRR